MAKKDQKEPKTSKDEVEVKEVTVHCVLCCGCDPFCPACG